MPSSPAVVDGSPLVDDDDRSAPPPPRRRSSGTGDGGSAAAAGTIRDRNLPFVGEGRVVVMGGDEKEHDFEMTEHSTAATATIERRRDGVVATTVTILWLG